jgi:hypothetical protein
LFVVVLALAHAIGYAVLSAACVALMVHTARDPEPVDGASEDMIQGGLLAAAFALLVVLAGWGTARYMRGGGCWQLALAGAVATVGGTGYALVAVRELTDPGFVHDASLWLVLGVSVVVGVLGGALVLLTRRGTSVDA